MEVNAVNSICEALSTRVNELFPFGIENIWMKATGRDRYHITNILGISRDEWDLAIPFSGLVRRENQVKCDEWSMKLKLKVEFNNFVTSDEFGKRDQYKWFRFVGPLNPSAERFLTQKTLLNYFRGGYLSITNTVLFARRVVS